VEQLRLKLNIKLVKEVKKTDTKKRGGKILKKTFVIFFYNGYSQKVASVIEAR